MNNKNLIEETKKEIGFVELAPSCGECRHIKEDSPYLDSKNWYYVCALDELCNFRVEKNSCCNWFRKKEVMKVNNKRKWMVTAKSESGNRSGPFIFYKKPTIKELKKIIIGMGEELNCDGPGDYDSYVYLEINKL
jgi:hypothetical protein